MEVVEVDVVVVEVVVVVELVVEGGGQSVQGWAETTFDNGERLSDSSKDFIAK